MEVELNAEANDKRLNRLVALTVVVLSVAMGLGNIKDGNIVQAMAQAQANGLDRWSEYQATRTKLHIVETARTQLKAAQRSAVAASAIASFDNEAAKYRVESPKLSAEAKQYAHRYDALNFHDDQFDAAEASLATAISIAAVAALTESWLPLWAAWVFGGFGLFMTLCGFAGWGFHPDILSNLFG
ncbi:DUF4337 domain-containing protein [Sphingomonas flavescens]|uniref:DUF4337 domain-containing protein n=1 Tax=Sphingomonas flavescens TaxID=3132797 RepID=UPI002804CB04|nr:DUF4337 domain-containing protein [Sphingomonas limnosediminicola]